MILDLAAMLTLAEQCAPNVAPRTLTAIAHTESRFDTLAIGVNGRSAPVARPATPARAVEIARRRLAAGENLDLGVAQINHRNLDRLGLTLEGAFDACRNLAAAGRLLTSDFKQARRSGAAPQAALRIAFSRYNTGDDRRGFANGYVGKVEASAKRLGLLSMSNPVQPHVVGLDQAPTPAGDVAVFAKPTDRRRLVFLGSDQ